MASFFKRLAVDVEKARQEDITISAYIKGKYIKLTQLIQKVPDDLFDEQDGLWAEKYRSKKGREAEQRKRQLDRDVNDDGLTEEEREKKKKKDKEKEFLVASIVEKLDELKKEAEAHPNLPGADRAKKLADDYLKDPEVLQAMSLQENRAAEKEVKETKLKMEETIEASVSAKAKKELKDTVPENCPKDKTPEEYFAEQKGLLADHAARMLAVKTLATTVKSYMVADKTMTEKEKKELRMDVLSEKNIINCTKDIKSRDDFKAMMGKVKDWNSFNEIKSELTEKTGGDKLFDRLAKTSKEMIQTESKRMTVEEVNAEIEAMQRTDARILKPTDNTEG